MRSHLPANLPVPLLQSSLRHLEAKIVDRATCVSEFFHGIPSKRTLNKTVAISGIILSFLNSNNTTSPSDMGSSSSPSDMGSAPSQPTVRHYHTPKVNPHYIFKCTGMDEAVG